jgi:hypothetical protein
MGIAIPKLAPWGCFKLIDHWISPVFILAENVAKYEEILNGWREAVLLGKWCTCVCALDSVQIIRFFWNVECMLVYRKAYMVGNENTSMEHPSWPPLTILKKKCHFFLVFCTFTNFGTNFQYKELFHILFLVIQQCTFICSCVGDYQSCYGYIVYVTF